MRRRDLLRLSGGGLVVCGVHAQPRGEVRVLLAAETAQHVSLAQALRSRWPAVTTHSAARVQAIAANHSGQIAIAMNAAIVSVPSTRPRE